MSWLARAMNGKGAAGLLRLLAIAQAVIICLALLACGSEPTPTPTPPEASRAISFVTEDGVEIRGRLFGQSETGVVLAHMFPADQMSWWEFAQDLAENDYMALAFDFRGYGDSGGDKEIKLIDLDLKAALGLLRQEGASAIFLIGASMGGTASLKVAAREKVAAVVSLSAPVEFKGIGVKGEQVRVPVLLMATDGDSSAKRNLETMVGQGIVADLAESVVYETGNDHGTDILKGDNSNEARARILSFLEAHRP